MADELESKLVAVNDGSALRPPWVVSCKQTGKGGDLEQTEVRVKKNKRERAKRDGERSQIERMSRLFRVGNPQRTWTRVEVLSFGEACLFSVDWNDCSPGSFQRSYSSFGVPAPSRKASSVKHQRHRVRKQKTDRNGLDFLRSSLSGQIPLHSMWS